MYILIKIFFKWFLTNAGFPPAFLLKAKQKLQEKKKKKRQVQYLINTNIEIFQAWS